MSNDPFGGDELPGDASDDLQKLRAMRNRDHSWAPPAIMEAVFASLTGLVAVIWFAGLFLFNVEGTTWMGLGALGGVLFGIPTAVIYALRRGGAAVLEAMIKQYLG